MRSLMRSVAGILAAFSFILGTALIVPGGLAADRQDSRRLGEEVLMEALLGSRQLMVRVATGGCTEKDSFKVEVKKAPDSDSRTPCYILTLNRVKPDDCKAFFPDGTPILFDLEKDLGLKGAFTYSLSNKVAAAPESESSLFGIIKKYFTVK